MTPHEILPDLTAKELDEFIHWITSLPLRTYATGFIYETVKDLAYELNQQASMRRSD